MSSIASHAGLGDVCFLSSSSLLFSGITGLSSLALSSADASPTVVGSLRIVALSASEANTVAVADAKHAVQLYSVSPDGTSVSYACDVCKFTDDVLCVALSKDGAILACGAANGELKFFDTSIPEQPKQMHSVQVGSAVTSVVFDPSAEFVTVSSCDGLVRVRFLNENRPKSIFTTSPKPIKDVGHLSGRVPLLIPDFHPDGNLLAVPHVGGEIRFHERKDDWTASSKHSQTFVLEIEEDAAVAGVAFSRGGQYLACHAGNVVHIWDWAKKVIVSSKCSENEDDVVVRLSWSPCENTLAFVMASGKLQVWENVIPEELPEPKETVAITGEAELEAMFQPEEAKEDDFQDDFFGDDALLMAAAESAERQAAEKRQLQEEQATATKTPPAKKALLRRVTLSQSDQLNETREDGSAMIEDDDDDGNGDDLQVILPPMDDENADAFESPYSVAPVNHAAAVAAASGKAIEESVSARLDALVARFGLYEAPEMFNPSATTSVSSTANRRVLIWNRVGRAICIDDRVESIVEVEFADVSAHRKIRVADLYSYNMGALSEAGVALAASAVHEVDTRAVVHFKPVAGLVGGAEWQELLEAGDDVLGVAVGHDWVAAVCGPYMYLRIWSVAGVQTMPIQLPISQFVSMVGQGTRLSIFYASAAGMGVIVYDLALRRQVFNVPAPLTPKAVLTWCGYTPTGVVVTVDSAGVGRMLINSGDWAGQWVPLIQPEGQVDLERKWPLGWPIGATDDSLIVVRLSETEEIETGLVLDDDNRGAPAIDTIRWATPLAAPNSALSVGLEGVLRRRLMLSQSAEPNPRRELEIDSEIVKLVVLSAKNQMPQRALELFSQLRSNQTKLVAMKWIGSNGYDQLFTKMETEWRAAAKQSLGVSALQDEDDEDEDDVDEDEQEEQQIDHEDEESEELRRRKSMSPSKRSNAVFDDERASLIDPTPAKQAKKKRSNPFSASKKTGTMRRSSSSGSGGVLEALARIESKDDCD